MTIPLQYTTVPPLNATVPLWHGSVPPHQTAFELNHDDLDDNRTKGTNDGYLQAGT